MRFEENIGIVHVDVVFTLYDYGFSYYTNQHRL